MINININNKTEVDFSDITVGDFFMANDNICVKITNKEMKIDGSTALRVNDTNSIALFNTISNSGVGMGFRAKRLDKVTKIDEIKIKLNIDFSRHITLIKERDRKYQTMYDNREKSEKLFLSLNSGDIFIDSTGLIKMKTNKFILEDEKTALQINSVILGKSHRGFLEDKKIIGYTDDNTEVNFIPPDIQIEIML